MSIQGSINQAINIGTALYTQTPQFEAKKNIKEAKRKLEGVKTEWKALEEQEKALKGKKRLSEAELKYYTEQLAPQMFKTGQELNKLRASTLPKEKAEEEIAKGLSRGTEQYKTIGKYTKRLRDLANKRAGDIKEGKAEQKRSFTNYLAGMETSFGGTVGELSPAAQAAIAKQYSSTERKNIMNKMDKEKENK